MLSQVEVAERLKVSAATVRNWEAEATAVPAALEIVWPVWERRLQQESPHFGTVTLFYTPTPMWVPVQGPRLPPGIPGQEFYPTNASALARVCALWGRTGFDSPVILQESRDFLWTTNELELVATGQDTGAPTVPTMLRGIGNYLRAYSARYVRNGPRLPSPTEVVARQREIEVQAEKLERLADADTSSSTDSGPVGMIFDRLHLLGMSAPGGLVNGVYQAYVVRALPWPTA